MITVYAEREGYAEQIAIFQDDKLYNDCLPQLERWAKDYGFDKITESEGIGDNGKIIIDQIMHEEPVIENAVKEYNKEVKRWPIKKIQ